MVSYAVHWARECLAAPPPVEWIVEGIVANETLNCLFGEGDSKKTYSQIDQGICIATGADWLGFSTLQRNVLFVDEECGLPRMQDRIYKTLRGHGIGKPIPLAFVSMAGFNLMTATATRDLKKLIREVKAQVIYIDALADVMPGGDENTARDTSIVFNNLKKIVHDLHVTINLIHHANRGGAFRGSSNIRNQVDTMIEVESKRGSPNMDFKSLKSRDTEPFDFAAVAHFGETSFRLVNSIGKVKSDDFILNQLREGITTLEQWEANTPERLKVTAIKPALQRLMKAGKVVRANEGGRGDHALYQLNGEYK